jgi:hypothetical protein
MYNSQKPTPSTVPFVPSQEREWSSVMIGATPVTPGNQVASTGAGRSTALNETRIQVPQVMRLYEEENSNSRP